MNSLFSAKKASSDPAHLVHACADIISTARECFDYLGQDIIEGYVVPNTTSAKIKKAHADGTLKAYFPYFQSQLTKQDSIFFELKSHTPALYQDLLEFASRIASKASIPDTLFNYQMLADVRDMVNEKKHDKLLAVVSEADAEFLVENPSFSMILPIKGQKGWSSFVAPLARLNSSTLGQVKIPRQDSPDCSPCSRRWPCQSGLMSADVKRVSRDAASFSR